MAPKTNSYDNMTFDNLFSSSSISASSPITTGKSTTTMGFWDGGPAYRSDKNIMMSTNGTKPDQTCYFDKHHDIPNAVTMDTTIAPSFSEAPTTPDWEDELHSFTFRRMNSPCSSSSSSRGVEEERIFDFDNTSFNQTFIDVITSPKMKPNTTTATAALPSTSKWSMIETINQKDKERITTLKTAEISDGTTSKKANVGAALHSWSDEFVVVSASPIKSSRKEEEEEDETYQSGLKGDHRQRPIGGLATGFTNAIYAMNDGPTQTKLPMCWHKELDPEKQQAKIERARQKLAQKKQKKSQRKECKGWRAIFGNPKAIRNSKTKPETSSTMDVTHSNGQQQGPNVMTVHTMSTAKDPLKLLFGNPKPLKERPTAATSRSLFV